MNTNTHKNISKKISVTFLLLFGWHSAQGCDITQNSLGNTIFDYCLVRENQHKLKMPNLRVKSTYISIVPGGGTGLEIGFEIENSGQLDSDKGYYYSGYSLNGHDPGFNFKSTVYIVSEGHSNNIHYDTHTAQWMPYSQTTQRINKLAAGNTEQFHFGTTGSPQFFLRDRDFTYKIGIVIQIDEPQLISTSTKGVAHGEVVESNEQDNDLNLECLVYGYNISDLSEILQVESFHINNDLNLPLVGPCL